MTRVVKVNRRSFLKVGTTASAGLMLAFQLPLAAAAKELLAFAPQPSKHFAPNAFLSIAPDSTVTIWVSRSEMGQGVRTSLPMLVAEELEADWAKIRIEQAPLDAKYGEQRTGGSLSIRELWLPLRTAGATARESLITAAAQQWGVPRETCRAFNGAVSHQPSKRRLVYGALVAAAAKLPLPKAAEVQLKDPKDFKLIGRRMLRIDGPAIVSGTANYGLDTRIPGGMLVATIERSRVIGGKVASFDATKAQAIPGVRHVIPLDNGGATFGLKVWMNGVAVVADSTWAAIKGREALEIKWDEGPNANLSSTRMSADFKLIAEQPGTRVPKVTRHDGDPMHALAIAAQKLEAAYEVPYLAHAPIETMNCVADVRQDACEIWAPTQMPGRARIVAAQVTGLPPEAITVHVTLLGGGFGRRLVVDYVVEAVQISKAIGRPVQLVWSRQDETRHGFYRPASYHRFTAGIDTNKRPTAWTHRIVSPSRAAFGNPNTTTPEESETYAANEVPYAIPNFKVEFIQTQSPVPISAWRGVAYSQTGFVTECFFDELAAACGQDPYKLRLQLLQARKPFKNEDGALIDPGRLTAVLELAATKAGWGRPLPKGLGRGLALGADHGSYVAQVAEVSVNAAGHLRVHRFVCAIDCGIVVNPETVAAQMEGGVVFGLSAALKGEITIERGQVQQSSFRDYDVLRMREMPRVEVHIVPSHEPPGGVGEPCVPPAAPALVNAIFAATGKRIRRLPVRPADLRST